jgi:hypothetical protein
MTIPASARPAVPTAGNIRIPIVDPKTGALNPTGINVLTDLLNYIQGSSRLIPCEETGTNVLALKMLPVSPLISQYNDYDVFQFVAAATSTGPVTANLTVVQGQLVQGTLATLKVFKAAGATQATTGDIVLGSFYHMSYVDSVDSGAGGFVLI